MCVHTRVDGSGKRCTMNGSVGDPGVNDRALQNLFNIAAERSNRADVHISVSMMEIYNEKFPELIIPGRMME